jgi:2-hydroxychromene-2-carboxylate isomerase
MTARDDIDFYFDFASPYGYFMSEKIDALVRNHGRKVTWRPVMLFAVLRALDLPAPMAHPIKRDYMLADFERSSRFLGIRYRLPDKFPIITPHAARGFYLLARYAPDAAVPFAHAVLRSYWQQGRDITDVDLIAGLLVDASATFGSPAQARERLCTDESNTLLQTAIAAAVERRVFGSPYVIVDGEPFFGVDRLAQIKARLERDS